MNKVTMGTAIREEDLRVQLKNKYGDEKVFVVAQEDIPAMVEGYVGRSHEVLGRFEKEGFFADRWRVESNHRVRQPIPYIILRCGNKYFAMRRLEGAGEARLHGKISMGVGGHINPCDQENKKHTLWENALWRELHEELNIEDSQIKGIGFLGLINDNSNPVSKDHIGLIYLVDVADTNITVKETDKYEGGFYTLDQLIDIGEGSFHSDKFESWTSLVLNIVVRYEE